MSFINSRGDIFHGVGGGYASLNNIAFARGGAAGFISDDDCFFANGDAAWVASIFNITTRAIRPAIEDIADPQFGQSLNTGYAGGGVWAAWQGSNDSHRGLYSSTGFRIPDGGLLGVGPDGEIGYKPSYQSNGPSLVIDVAGQRLVAAAIAAGKRYEDVESSLLEQGRIRLLTAGHAADLQLLGGGRAVWKEGSSIVVDGVPQPKWIGSIWGPRMHLVADRWWVSYYSSEVGIVVHPFDNFTGYQIVAPGIDTWHSARVLADGRLRFALSTGEGEQPGQVRPYDVDFSQQPVDLKPATPLPPVVLPSRPLWIGCFEFQQSPQGPGNIAVAVRNITGHASRAQVVTSETISAVTGDVAGQFISGASVDAVEAQAKTLTKRPVAYWDDNRWPRWPGLPSGSWICVRAYQPVGQSLEDFERSVAAQITAAPYPVALVGQAYTQAEPPPSVLTKDLAPLQRVLLRLASQHSNVVALLLFSGFGRDGGLEDHPDELAFWTGIVPQVARPPIESLKWPPVTPPDPPKPSGLFKLAKRIEGLSMSATNVALRLGQFFASVDPTAHLDADGYRVDKYGRGPFPGWYPVRFRKETVPTDANALFLLSQPRQGDPKLLVRPASLVESNCAMSADATEYSGDISSQFGVKPGVVESEWGGYEAWNGWTLGGDQIDIILVEYDRDGQKYTSANLTVVRL